jgi:hypothetical protein
MASVPRQQTSVLWLLDWLRVHSGIKKATLKYETDVGFNVEVLLVPSKVLGASFRAAANKELGAKKGDLEDGRRRLLRRLLEEELEEGPELLDVELYGAESTSEVASDFSTIDGFLKIPVAFYATFKMKKKSAPTKTSETGGTAPRSNSGGPRYVVERDDYPEPGRPTWRPNPDYPKVALLMTELKRLIRPKRPTLKVIAKALNAKKHRTLRGRPFTEQNVDRAIVAAELLLGNRDPSFKN